MLDRVYSHLAPTGADAALITALTKEDPGQIRTFRTELVSLGCMKTIRANDVRIPAEARAALDRHEEVLVVNHGRPALVIVSAADHAAAEAAPAPGRPLREAAAMLSRAPLPDEALAADLEAVRAATGPVPDDPWEPS
jgi:hypothetical protein